MTIYLPEDYETCGDCGFDHDYEPAQAAVWHTAHPGSYGCGDGAGPGEHTINVLGHLTREQRIELYRKARDVEDVCGSPDDACFDEDAYFEALKETPE